MSCRVGECTTEWCYVCGSDISDGVHQHFHGPLGCNQFDRGPGHNAGRGPRQQLSVALLFMQGFCCWRRCCCERDTRVFDEPAIVEFDEILVCSSIIDFFDRRSREARSCLVECVYGLSPVFIMLPQIILGFSLSLAVSCILYSLYALVALPLAAVVALFVKVLQRCGHCNCSRHCHTPFLMSFFLIAHCLYSLCVAPIVLLFVSDSLLLTGINWVKDKLFGSARRRPAYRPTCCHSDHRLASPCGTPVLNFFFMGNFVFGVVIPAEILWSPNVVND
jgi:hypothetical protein